MFLNECSLPRMLYEVMILTRNFLHHRPFLGSLSFLTAKKLLPRIFSITFSVQCGRSLSPSSSISALGVLSHTSNLLDIPSGILIDLRNQQVMLPSFDFFRHVAIFSLQRLCKTTRGLNVSHVGVQCFCIELIANLFIRTSILRY